MAGAAVTPETPETPETPAPDSFAAYCTQLVAQLGRPLRSGEARRARNGYSLGLPAQALAAQIKRGARR
jgi:hypothetical protein